ncbi:guanine nucleotide-binding protein [Artemisia annua]|uniref:Guanine nucleotide-binding protein n=1 Tax=Artemisia annua TaxID=35608 RepID=A0A2U1NBT1_ARTAN|nr:guanine nucleotide-binding protein [Artemisia annua]
MSDEMLKWKKNMEDSEVVTCYDYKLLLHQGILSTKLQAKELNRILRFLDSICKIGFKMKLEQLLYDQVYSIYERKELEKVTPSATLKYCFYQPTEFDHHEMKLTPMGIKAKSEVTEILKIPVFGYVEDFLSNLATVRGKLKKGNVLDNDVAARIIFQVWDEDLYFQKFNIFA